MGDRIRSLTICDVCCTELFFQTNDGAGRPFKLMVVANDTGPTFTPDPPPGLRMGPKSTFSDHGPQRRLPPRPLLLRNCCPQHLPGLAVDERKAQRGGALAESAHEASAAARVVGMGPGVAIDEPAGQGAIDENGERAGGDGFGLADPDRQAGQRRRGRCDGGRQPSEFGVDGPVAREQLRLAHVEELEVLLEDTEVFGLDVAVTHERAEGADRPRGAEAPAQQADTVETSPRRSCRHRLAG